VPTTTIRARRRGAGHVVRALFSQRALARVAFVRVALLLCTAATTAAAQAEPYRNRSLPVDTRVSDLLGRMTRVEKFRQLFMAPGSATELDSLDLSTGLFGLQVRVPTGVPSVEAARTHATQLQTLRARITNASRLGIPPLFFEEALHGVMDAGATMFPQAIGLGATFDTGLVHRVHAAAAREMQSRGLRMALSPVVNLANDVRWGRTEETFGEDPWLVGAMGRAHVRAFEQAGLVATPKHFVANVGEGGRDSWPIDISARALEERFFPPFRSAFDDAGARSVMTAYNSVDGDPATQSRLLLHTTLRERWRFGGFVISDASATSGATVLHRTERNTAEAFLHAITSGLDVVFQGGLRDIRPYERAVTDGVIPDSLLDRAAARVLRAKFQLGLFDEPAFAPDSAAYWNGHAEHLALAREAARASLVLLRNSPARSTARAASTAPTLPLASSVQRIALIGEDADSVRLGGYSGSGFAPVSIRSALSSRAGVSVRYAAGPGRDGDSMRTVPAQALSHTAGAGLAAEYWNNPDFAGAPTVRRIDPTIAFTWTLSSPARGLPYDWYAARWTGTLTVPAGGLRAIGIDGRDGVRVWVDDVLVLDRWEARSSGRWVAPVSLTAGPHALRVEFHERRGNARLTLLWDADVERSADARIAEAVDAARASDVAVVVVGVEEGEFRDRSKLSLPGHQDALVRAVSATGVPTVVVIVGGSAITMPWLDEVDAVLMAWYPGEQGGPAIADVLFGDASPSGRLPITFPQREGQLPLTYDHKPTGRGDDYLDGSGAPLFPFGHGLSYTTFAWDSLHVTTVNDRAGDDVRVQISARIRNTGPRAGHEVVQLYVRDEVTSVAQPLIALRGAARVALEPGASTRVAFTLGARELALLDRDLRWRVEPGTFRVMLGASSRDIRLRDIFTLR
jgi:beta-glucosidase